VVVISLLGRRLPSGPGTWAPKAGWPLVCVTPVRTAGPRCTATARKARWRCRSRRERA